MFNKSPKFYTVYIKPKDDTPLESALFLKEGFSLWPAVFTVFWLLYYRLWRPAIIVGLIVLTLEIALRNGYIDLLVNGVIRLALFVYIGLSASEWYGASLLKRGYILAAIVSARDLLEAQQRFFTEYPVEQQPNTSPYPSYPAQALLS